MLQKVKVEEIGDTNFLEGEQVDKHRFREENEKIIAEELIDVIFYVLDASRLACPSIDMDSMFAWKLKKNGYRESTIISRVKMLRALARRADLSDPESIKAAIADLDVSEGRKENLVCTYRGFCGQYGIPFQAPRYRIVDQLPFIR